MRRDRYCVTGRRPRYRVTVTSRTLTSTHECGARTPVTRTSLNAAHAVSIHDRPRFVDYALPISSFDHAARSRSRLTGHAVTGHALSQVLPQCRPHPADNLRKSLTEKFDGASAGRLLARPSARRAAPPFPTKANAPTARGRGPAGASRPAPAPPEAFGPTDSSRDFQAPWSVRQTKLADNRWLISMRKRMFTMGGDGETELLCSTLHAAEHLAGEQGYRRVR